MQASALAARKLADDLLLVRALEVEAADVAARRRLVAADRDHVRAAGDFLPHGLLAVERIARLVDVRELHGRAHDNLAAVGLLDAGDELEKRRLARAVRTDDADDRAGRNLEAQIVDQHAVAERLRDVLELDDEIAEPLARRDIDFVRLVARLVFDRVQLLEPVEARL